VEQCIVDGLPGFVWSVKMLYYDANFTEHFACCWFCTIALHVWQNKHSI